MAPLYENQHRSRDDRSPESASATFLARPQAGRAGASYSKQPDFTSLLSDRLGENTLHSAGDNGLETSFSRAGAELIRSQSAAPSFHGRSPLFPPPGLADIKETQPAPTPSTVDSYSTGSHSNSGSHNFESAVDRGADIMQLGQRRPASTGVIGNTGLYAQSGGVGGALRQNNGLMDLIQEDDVPSNHRGDIQQNLQQQNQQDNYSPYSGMNVSVNNNHGRDNRLQQSSPSMSRNGGGGGEPQYMYTQQQQQIPHHLQQHPHQMQHQYMQQRGGDPHLDRMQQPGMRARDQYDTGAPQMVNQTLLSFMLMCSCPGNIFCVATSPLSIFY